MRKILFVILSLGFIASLAAQSPHGPALKIDCAACHSSEGWEIDAGYWSTPDPPRSAKAQEDASDIQRFKHSQTNFDLKGQHAEVDCRACHETLVFSEASSACVSCHTDIHQQTAGADCARCHNASNWLVNDIAEIHLENGFPLLGMHAITNCTDCHRSETALRFDRLGQECINCHQEDYLATTTPNHKAAGYPTNCEQCHDQASPDWLWSEGKGGHLFFPLTKGHQVDDCMQCHTGGNFLNTPTDCFSCHEVDYQSTNDPDHEAVNFPTDCAICHSTDLGWPANNYTEHDQAYFPIFSGKHKNKWDQCTDCHTTAGNYMEFNCIICHDDAHHQDQGNIGCFECHPKGR